MGALAFVAFGFVVVPLEAEDVVFLPLAGPAPRAAVTGFLVCVRTERTVSAGGDRATLTCWLLGVLACERTVDEVKSNGAAPRSRTGHWRPRLAVGVVLCALVTLVPGVTFAEEVRAPLQTGEGAGLGSPVQITGTAAYRALPVPFEAEDPRLIGWFVATGSLLDGLSESVVEAQYEYIDASQAVDAAVQAVQVANLEAARFAIRYGITSDVAMMELGLLYDMALGSTPPQEAVRSLETLRRMQDHSDTLISTAQRDVVRALAELENAKIRVRELGSELASARRFAAHLVEVDALIAGTEVPTSSIDALLFTVSAPAPAFPVAMPWENPVAQVGRLGSRTTPSGATSIGDSSRNVERLRPEPPVPGTIDVVLRVPASKLAEVELQLTGRSYAIFPTASLQLGSMPVQAIGVDDATASTIGLDSAPNTNFVVASSSARVAGSLRIGDEKSVTMSAKRYLDRSGVGLPALRERTDRSVTTFTTDGTTRAVVEDDPSSSPSSPSPISPSPTSPSPTAPSSTSSASTAVIAGFAPLIPGAGLAVPAGLLADAEEYLVAIDHSGDADATRFSWTLMLQHPSGSVIRSSAAPAPSEFYTPVEAAGVLGTLRYETFEWRANSRDIDIADSYAEKNIGVRKYPILGEFACNTAISAQLAGALAEAVLRGLGDEIDPAKFGGCYNPRLIRVGSGPSFHAWGLAVDLNVSENLMYTPGSMHDGIIAVFKAWGFRWGGDWSSIDPMHFETAALLRPEN